MFGDTAETVLGMSPKQALEVLSRQPDIALFYNDLKIVGRELVVSGTIRRDKFSDQLEMRASDVRVPDPVQEAKGLLKKLKETP